MNILEYVTQSKKVQKLTIEFDGEKIDFHIKNLTQAEAEIMSGKQAEILPIYKKQQQDKELSEDELKTMLSFQSSQTFEVLCDESGNNLFDSKEAMKNAIPARLFKAMSDQIIKLNSIEEAEKN